MREASVGCSMNQEVIEFSWKKSLCDALIKNTVKNGCKIKASGGIRKLEDLLTMVNCGADRIGTSSGVAIYNELINFEDNIVQSSKN